MIERLLLNLRARDEISGEEEKALRGVFDSVETLPAKATVVRRGVPLQRSVLLIDGLICRHKDLGNGQRQISAIHVPGDFVDLHGYTLKHLDHDVAGLSAVKVAYAPFARLDRLTEDFPHLTRLLWGITNRDAARHREWELSLGARTAIAKIANLFCELFVRLRLVGLTSGNEFDLPVSQTELGECAGLTNVHTNRMLKELRDKGAVDFRGHRVIVTDLDELKRIADFDPLYLYV